MTTDRELRATTTINAPADAVWEVLSDLDRLPTLSPELVKMLPLRRGGLRVGQHYLGLNRRKLVVWPTRNVVATLVPGRELAWDTRSSGARWIFELTEAGTATQVVHRRPVPTRLTLLGRAFAGLALGGSAEHAHELEAGMATTLARLKAVVEA